MQNTEDRIERIIDVRDGIDFGKVTILTGGNGGGKSFIRKQIQLICKNESIPCWTVSMDRRAGFDGNGTGVVAENSRQSMIRKHPLYSRRKSNIKH